jgi:hypothetical protein
MDNQELQHPATIASTLQSSFSATYGASTLVAAIIPLPNTQQVIFFKALQHQFSVLEDADETVSFKARHVPLC